MAQQGMEHWRRAVRWTFVGIFAVALAGGLLGRMTAGNGFSARADASAAGLSRPDARRPRHGGVGARSRHRRSARSPPPGRPRSSRRRQRGGRQRSSISPTSPRDGPGGAPAAPTRVTPWSPQLASCVGIPSRVAKIAPTKVQSPDFSSADKVDAVEDSVSVYPSAAQAQSEFAAMAGSKTTVVHEQCRQPARWIRACNKRPGRPRPSAS